MDTTTARIIRALTRKRGRRVDPVELAFGVQREAITCHAQLVSLLCSGRAGKTQAFILKWLEVCQRKPGYITPYIALTVKAAKRIIWPSIKRIDREHGLGLKFNEANLTVRDEATGSELHLLGANREDLIDVLRGFPMPLCGFDEAGFFRQSLLRKAVEDAVLIRLMDLDGELWLMGTPGLVPNGYFYDATVNAGSTGWVTFHWTFFDNPHLPLNRPDLSLEEKRQWRINWARAMRKRKGWTEKTPSYVREFLGRFVRDAEAQVYGFDRRFNVVRSMPDSWRTHRDLWTVVLSQDYGVNNATTWHIWAFELGKRDVYSVRSFRRAGLAPSQAAKITKRMIRDYKPEAVVGDSGGLGKGFIKEAQVRFLLPIEAAEKTEKRGYIAHMNDGFASRTVWIVESEQGGENTEYIEEMESLQWNPKYDQGHPKWRMEEDPEAQKDLCDGGLYGWRRCYAYMEGLDSDDEDDTGGPPASDPDPDDEREDDDETEYLL